MSTVPEDTSSHAMGPTSAVQKADAGCREPGRLCLGRTLHREIPHPGHSEHVGPTWGLALCPAKDTKAPVSHTPGRRHRGDCGHPALWPWVPSRAFWGAPRPSVESAPQYSAPQ